MSGIGNGVVQTQKVPKYSYRFQNQGPFFVQRDFLNQKILLRDQGLLKYLKVSSFVNWYISFESCYQWTFSLRKLGFLGLIWAQKRPIMVRKVQIQYRCLGYGLMGRRVHFWTSFGRRMAFQLGFGIQPWSMNNAFMNFHALVNTPSLCFRDKVWCHA